VKSESLARLGVTPAMILAVPQITPQLRMIARTIRGSSDSRVPYGPGTDLLKSWPNYLEATTDVECQRVRQVYYGLPRVHRSGLPIEAFCVAASVSPLHVLEALTATVMRLGVQASSIIASVNHPRVVQKTIDVALTDDGHKDREMLHKHANFLPTPAGARTSIVVTQTAQATAAAQTVAAPPPEATIRRLADRFNLARALPERVTTPFPAIPDARDVECVEVEADDVRDK
jgi:hypothetical protein